MKIKNDRNLYQWLGAGVVLLIILVINLISASLYMRLDLTKERLYTLSDGTREILGGLKEPITIRFYCSQGSNRMPMQLKIYAQRIEDILAEYRRAAKGKIIIEKYNPQPETEAEEAAEVDGIEAKPLSNGERLYLGIAVNRLDKTAALAYLAPQRENTLEYELSRAIVQVTRKNKDLVAVMSSLPVLGSSTPQKMADGRFLPPQAWVAIRELQKDFDVALMPLETEVIDKHIKLIILIHPSGISEKTQFALDQFLLRGGKIIAFLDPQSHYSLIKAQQEESYQNKYNSSIDKLLKAWGLSFNTNIMVADMKYAQRINTPEKVMTIAGILCLDAKAANSNSVISGQLENIQMYFSGYFVGEPAKGITMTPLLESSTESQPVSSFLSSNPELIVRNFKPLGQKLPVAILLSGKFPTAFPAGRPGGDPKENTLKQSQVESSVALIGDSDMLVNEVCVESAKGNANMSAYVRKNDNISLLQNLAEYFCGDDELISVRCRAVSSRPFTVIRDIVAKADQRYKDKAMDIVKEVKETETRLNQLHRDKARDQVLVLSAEQQAEFEKLKEKTEQANKEIKKLFRKRNAEIEGIQTSLKWLNIALVPTLVCGFGLGLALWRKRKHSAR